MEAILWCGSRTSLHGTVFLQPLWSFEQCELLLSKVRISPGRRAVSAGYVYTLNYFLWLRRTQHNLCNCVNTRSQPYRRHVGALSERGCCSTQQGCCSIQRDCLALSQSYRRQLFDLIAATLGKLQGTWPGLSILRTDWISSFLNCYI